MKRNSIKNYIPVIALFFVIYAVLELFIPLEEPVVKNPFAVIFLIVVFLLLLVIQSVNNIINFLKFQNLTKEQKLEVERQMSERNKSPWWEKLLSGGKVVSEEEENRIILNHDYDGIKEFDNKLPGWWLNLFYITIIFSVIYLTRYHIVGSSLQEEEFDNEIAEVERIKKLNPPSITIDNVELLEDEASLAEGKSMFEGACVACHLNDGGGGIGPNFTDEYWIMGGGIKNVFNTIMEGGRPGKGMNSWKNAYTPEQVQKLASYVISLQGTTPANPKGREGDIIWKKGDDEAKI